MRLGQVAVVAVVTLVLLTTPASAAHVAPYDSHTTDTEFNNAATLQNVTVQGSGASANVSLEDTNPTIDSFEDNDLSEYSGSTGDWTIGIGDASDQLLKLSSDASSPGRIISTPGDGLPRYYDADSGEYSVDLKLNGNNRGVVFFSVADIDNSYIIEVEPGGLDVEEWDGGTTFAVAAVGNLDATVPTDQYLTLEIDDDESTANVRLYNTSSGNQLADASFNKDDKGDGIGFSANNSGVYFDNARISDLADKKATGTYISQNYSVEQVADGWANLTLENANAEVTWQGSNGGGWTDVATATYSSSGNRTIDLSGSNYDTWRVNVTFNRESGSTTATLHDEGIRVQSRTPIFDETGASPTSAISTQTPTLSIPVEDADFPTVQGDSVTVEFFVRGPTAGTFSSAGTDSLTSNGTASTSYTTSDAGTYDWYAQATDSYGNVETSSTLAFGSPGYLNIYNESDPDQRITESANVTFYGSKEFVRSNLTSDGTVFLGGLPINQTYIVEVKTDTYVTRTVYMAEPTKNSSVYVLPENASHVPIEYQLEDASGNFGPSSQLYIERPLNISGSTRWVTITSDEFGADGINVDLESAQRYRLRISNGQLTVQMGSYVAPNVTGEVVTLRPDAPAVNLSGADSVQYNASVESGTLNIRYVDPEAKTGTVTITVVNRFNDSDVIYGPTTYIKQQSISITEPVGTLNEPYVVEFNGTRDGQAFESRVLLGADQENIVPVGLSLVWIQAFGIGLILLVGGIFSELNVGVGIVVTSLFAGILWYIGLLQGVASWAAVAVAITFSVVYGLVINR